MEGVLWIEHEKDLYTVLWIEHDILQMRSDLTIREAMEHIDRLTIRGCSDWTLSPKSASKTYEDDDDIYGGVRLSSWRMT